MTGQTISHYRILDKLGEGGMGVVYKAEDTKLKRTVALKFVRPDAVASEEAKARFLHEAEAAAALDHPNICTVHEIDEDAGRTFIVMGYVKGPTLKQKIVERPLPLDEALEYAVQIGGALHAAHQQGIVHRDIKPANVIVTPEGQVKVMDFGLARLGGETRLTRTGAVMGTPAYMSPEQAQGRPLDHRTDIWSLGAVLYEMVSGRAPFAGETEQGVAYAIVHEQPEPLTALRAGLPVQLDRIVSKALAKEPGERYQHADDLVVDLRAAREGLPVRFAKAKAARPRRREILLAGAGVLAAAVVLALVLNPGGIRDRLRGGAGGPPVRSIAVLPLQNLSGDPDQQYFSDGMTDALITDLSKISALKVISRTSVMQYKDARKALPEIARELGVETVLEGSVVREGGRVRVTAQLIEASSDRHLWAESYERELSSVLALQSEIARAVASGVRVRLQPREEARLTAARQVNPATHEAYLRGMFYLNKSTPADVRKGMEYLQQAVEADPADPLAYAGLALGYIEVGHGSAAQEDSMQRAKAAARTALKLDPTLAEAAAALGAVEGYWEWKWDDAFRSLQKALDANPSLAIAYYHRAWFHALFGRLEEAIADHKRARELDPFNPLHTAWLGELYRMGGRHEEAAAEARKSIEMAPGFSYGHFVLGLVHLDRGEYDEAVAAMRKAGEADPALRWALGPAYAAAGRTGAAREILAELNREEPSPWVAFFLVWTHAALGDIDESFRWMSYEPHHAWVAWVRVLFWPGFEALCKDPRFPAQLRRMNLPE